MTDKPGKKATNQADAATFAFEQELDTLRLQFDGTIRLTFSEDSAVAWKGKAIIRVRDADRRFLNNQFLNGRQPYVVVVRWDRKRLKGKCTDHKFSDSILEVTLVGCNDSG